MFRLHLSFQIDIKLKKDTNLTGLELPLMHGLLFA